MTNVTDCNAKEIAGIMVRVVLLTFCAACGGQAVEQLTSQGQDNAAPWDVACEAGAPFLDAGASDASAPPHDASVADAAPGACVDERPWASPIQWYSPQITFHARERWVVAGDSISQWIVTPIWFDAQQPYAPSWVEYLAPMLGTDVELVPGAHGGWTAQQIRDAIPTLDTAYWDGTRPMVMFLEASGNNDLGRQAFAADDAKIDAIVDTVLATCDDLKSV